MTDLLTLNGVPVVTIVGSLTIPECAAMDAIPMHPEANNYFPPFADMGVLQPFAREVGRVVDLFAAWGAAVRVKKSHIREWTRHIQPGESTFDGHDLYLHTDRATARRQFNEENLLILRFLYASRNPADFIDLTGRADMMNLMDRHRAGGPRSRLFDDGLFKTAQENGGRIVRPPQRSLTIFDAMTPHKPDPVDQAGPRTLVNGWFEVCLPINWRAQVMDGDVPRLPDVSFGP